MKSKEQQVLFIHGAGEDAWQWSVPMIELLKDQLGSAYKIVFPKMPHPENPSYDAWKNALEKELNSLNKNVILIGHSLGGSVVLKYLTEIKSTVECRALFLLAIPYWGEGGWETEEFAIHNTPASRKGVPVLLYHNADDEDVPFAHHLKYREVLPDAQAIAGTHGGHAMLNLVPDVAKKIISMGDM